MWDLIVSVPDHCLSFSLYSFIPFLSSLYFFLYVSTSSARGYSNIVLGSGGHLALFSLWTESDNPDATCELSP